MGMTNVDSITAPDGLFGPSTLQGTVLTAITTAAADVTLTSDQANNTRLEVTTGHATHCIIVPTGLPGKIYIVVNADAVNAALIKVAGGTAVTVAATKSAIVQVNGAGSQITRISADV